MRIKDDYSSCNIELWDQKFYDLSRDSIIPVHQIYCQFVAGEYTIGKRNLQIYMSVIPLYKNIIYNYKKSAVVCIVL
jgi:hypothetical protein